MDYNNFVTDIYNEWILLSNLGVPIEERKDSIKYCIKKILDEYISIYDISSIKVSITEHGYLKILAKELNFSTNYKLSPTVKLNDENSIENLFKWINKNFYESLPF